MPTQFHFTALVTLGLALAGCSKKEPAAPGTVAAPAASDATVTAESPRELPAARRTSAPGQQAQPPAAAANEAPEALVGTVHDFMTSQLRIFVQEKGRLPNDFAEFANARMDSVPRAPQGMKYAIDTTTQEVKLVKAK